eukprot:CAMPEP_0202881788 /NCGR_PEP_ID=MMETSP1391-20130828/37065_1 /ASSEMBLY_ACC=CAM_ASM_000867 /TAXON_ID=1034604 /ORGANISM="Chlamydomonas leiostraca, Strain SAG 11-49" /LENGTH=30 /DNA_ID= /DNA_START= /DNA_END= /DNA_ORIENTATION=
MHAACPIPTPKQATFCSSSLGAPDNMHVHR